MLPIPAGPVTERYEFFASLLLKAHNYGATFWSWLRLNWIIFRGCGRVKIRASALCPKCYARELDAIGPIVVRKKRNPHVCFSGASRRTGALRAALRARPRPPRGI